MANETVARRYALAVFALADEQRAIDTVGKDLHVLRDAIYEDQTTKGFFLSPVIDRKEKERVLSAAFGGKADEIAMHTVLLLVRKRREALLREIVEQYDALQMQARGEEPLTVTSAKEMSASELRSLVDRLEKLYGKKFSVTQAVQPGLIGGVRIMMGDRRIDGTVEGRLEELTRTLFAKT
ncbi:MAG TPA: ATP synthase F1 subunit delta [Candidatus Baltobacteraceae bacterium]|nr:ATP synthase F1 subunit delta [Candidatus Baltobacteraceae bacterium]